MELDLGSRPTANVKVGADVFKMSVPTVKQSLKFNANVSSVEDDLTRTEVFMDFISELGMPAEVVGEISTHQLTKLAEGLMGSPEKK